MTVPDFPSEVQLEVTICDLKKRQNEFTAKAKKTKLKQSYQYNRKLFIYLWTSRKSPEVPEELDPASVIAEMSDMLNQALVDPHVAAAMLENFHLFEMELSGALCRR